MAKIVYCRYPDCGEAMDCIAGILSNTCPRCLRPALWSTLPLPVSSTRVYTLTHNDKKLLRSFGIDPAR